jgi:hypothetical protein
MATTIRRHGLEIDNRTSVELATGGSLAEALIAAVALLLAAFGLAGIYPTYAGSLAALAVGIALVFEGGAIGARFAPTFHSREGDSLTTGDVAGGITAELVAGSIGIVLAVFALIGFAPLALLPTAALVYSAGLLIGSAALSHSSTAVHEGEVELETGGKRDAVLIAAGAQIVVGLAGSALGIVALLGAQTLILSLVALLGIAASELLSGTAFGSRMLKIGRRI